MFDKLYALANPPRLFTALGHEVFTLDEGAY